MNKSVSAPPPDPPDIHDNSAALFQSSLRPRSITSSRRRRLKQTFAVCTAPATTRQDYTIPPHRESHGKRRAAAASCTSLCSHAYIAAAIISFVYWFTRVSLYRVCACVSLDFWISNRRFRALIILLLFLFGAVYHHECHDDRVATVRLPQEDA